MTGDLIVGLQPAYPVRLRESFAEVWNAIREDHGDRPWFVVADQRVLERQPGALRGLRVADRRRLFALPGGESVKSMRQLQRVQRAASDAGVHRDFLVVALGGGTVGDLAGFFAATWMRGIDWCPIATTSLSMADSSIGGKTAVDFAGVKNLVGSFHQPVGVYGALEALATCPPRHRRAGIAEIVKAGIIRDRELFELLEGRGAELEDPSSPLWRAVLGVANRVKAAIVEADPRESGERAVLNFGHTLGHALEGVHWPRLLHGEAVSLGMIAASWISEELRMAPPGTTERVRALAVALRLPRQLRGVDRARLWKALSYDKKGDSGQVRLVLTTGIGSATVGHVVGREVLRASLGALTPADRQR